IPVVVDNSAPSLYILSPTEGQVFERGKDEWINIQVEAEDNVSMQRVEFYMDGRLLGYSTVAPYTMMWMLKSSVAPEYDMNLPEPVEQETPEGIVRMEVTMEGDQRVFTRTVQKDGAVTTTRVVESPGGGISWTVTGPDGAILASSAAAGKHTIHVVAIDAAGNRVTSEPVQVEITYAKQDK
ncbi:MAG: hypothetical protein GX552_03435, partial [Chloroflexi bacterium]|nr:hypothetical protein [Chloroflexota bacterium]